MNSTLSALRLVALSSLVAPGAAGAQGLAPTSHHTLTLHTGAVLHTVHDRNASPLAYQGQLAQVGVSYQHRTFQSEWFVGARAAHGAFYAKAYPDRMVYFGDTPVPLRDNLTTASGQVHYLRRFATFEAGEVLVGGGLQQLLHYPQSEPHASMTSITSVPVVAQLRYALGSKMVLEAQGQYALAGLITRLPWHSSLSRPEETRQLKAFYRHNTQLEGGHRLQQAALTLAATHAFGTHWQAGLGYDFNLLRHPDPRPLTTLSHSLNLALRLTF
ncbi:hypothetical protein [Hymenobacter sp. YC55]|uniref:hypothetical protein n=1 Tax=Hymenobacter sp. YC55 TaxID=3034019 RepID=UPI0023F85AF0|nr:hypothetical protein [Hymenobacter sp. YC55]MDF7813774.1 hypothetical protein [Hymenobacter sp. YC55]